jgi:PAS domain S-box-containing protein
MSVEGINYLSEIFDTEENKDSFDGRLANFFPGIVYVYDIDRRCLKYINKRVTDFLGLPLEDLKDCQLDQLIFPEDLSLVQRELEKFFTLQDNASHTYNSRLTHREGGWRYFRTQGSILRRNANGKPASLLFVAQDITDQWKGQEEVKALRELLHETESLLQFGSWNWDAPTNTTHWTEGIYQLFEYQPGEVGEISREFFFKHMSAEDAANFQRHVKDAIDTKTGFECEYGITTRSGAQKFVSTKGKVILGETNEVVKMIGITRDITPLKYFERERERSIRELNRSNRELEEFAYVASHDLQEPLRKISTFSERLKAKFTTQLGSEGSLYVERILASTENMRILIDNLLEFSRMARSSYAFSRTDLKKIIQSVATDLELKIEETGAQLMIGPLPEVEVVEAEMKQLFNNLLGNAIKFRSESTPPVITISSEKATRRDKEDHHVPLEKEFVKITIQDNGIGFEEEYAEKIFQIFQRLHGKSEYPGSGIGLAICKKIMDNHNGAIYAESTPGHGAIFHLLLPEKQF